MEGSQCGVEDPRLVEAEDGTYVLALAKVVYVRRAERETQIGFAATA